MVRRLGWKRLLLAVSIACFAWFLQGLAGGSHVANASVTDFVYAEVSGNAVIQGYLGSDTEIVIPDTLGGYPVTRIGNTAFQSHGLTKVTLNEGLTSIGDYAFAGNDLTELEIPASVTKVGPYAFKDNKLTTLALNEGLGSIELFAFHNNELEELEIPASVTKVGANAFQDNKLTTLTLNEGLEIIEYAAFEGDFLTDLGNVITELEIPASVTSIGDNAFRSNNLTTVTLNEGLKSIGDNAFNRNRITEIEIPSSVESIGNQAFEYNRLTKVALNEGLVSILRDAFHGNALTEIEIPSSVTSIESEAFMTNDLTTVSLHSGLESIEDRAFADNSLTEIEIPPSVTSIGEWAFISNDLAFAAIPSSVNTIGNEAFGLNRPEFTIIGGIGTEAQTYAANNAIPFQDIATLLDIQFAPDGQGWAEQAATTVIGDTYGAFRLQYAWSNNEATPAPGAGWIPFASGDEIEQLSAGEWFLHVHGSLLDVEGDKHSEKFQVRRTPSTSDSDEKSSNARLKELIVSAGTLTPVFSGGVTQYTLRIDPEVQSITVTLLPEDGFATTSLGGQALGSGRVKADISLEPDVHQVEIVVTAEDATKRTYQVAIERDDMDSDEAKEPPTEAACSEQTPFTDIAGHWGEDFIIEAGCQAIVQGYPDGSFGPDRLVTRAEFTVMLAGLFPWEGDATALRFGDLTGKEHWAKQAIAQAAAAGVVSGYPDGRFGPEAAITRAEMSVMIANALGLPTDVYTTTAFADDAGIPVWAKNAVESIRRLGIVIGRGDNSFVPDGAATRAEAAFMLLRIGERSILPR